MPLARRAWVKARVVFRASSMRQALSRAAFSRSSSPMRPSRCERVIGDVGALLADNSARLFLAGGVQRREDGRDRDRAGSRRRGSAGPPPACRACRRGRAGGRRTRGRPPASPPRARTSSARSSGQSTKGGSEAPEGRPMRTAATRPRSRRWTTALVKWVVPIIAASASRAPGARSTSPARARVMPVVTSGVVGVFTAAATVSSSRSTASVLVPPTSMPMRRLTRTPSGSRGRSRRRAGPRARSPSG